MIVFDKAEYHLDDEAWPKELKSAQAQVHIAFYFQWLIEKDLADLQILNEKEKTAVESGKISASEVVDRLDGTLAEDMMTDEGADFSFYYYDNFLKDYEKTFLTDAIHSPYHVKNTPENYLRVKAFLDRNYEDWAKAGRPTPEQTFEKSKIWLTPIPDREMTSVIRYVRKELNVGWIFKPTEMEIEVDEFPVGYTFNIRIDPKIYPKVYQKFYKRQPELIKHIRPLTERSLNFILKKTTDKRPTPRRQFDLPDPYHKDDYKLRLPRKSPNYKSLSGSQLEALLEDLRAFLSANALTTGPFTVKCEETPSGYLPTIISEEQDFQVIANLLNRRGIEAVDKFKALTNKMVRIRVAKRDDLGL